MRPFNPNPTKRSTASALRARGLGLLAAGLLGLLVGACVDGDITLDTDCEQDGDCLGSQTCLATPYQKKRGQLGWCRESEECSAGVQPGCKCAAGTCTGTDSAAPEMAAAKLVPVKVACVFFTGMELQACIDDGVDAFEPDDCVCVFEPAA